ncbi:MAG: cysteine peptidase family C39 domain-containing protein [Rectinemataceae bacterium]|nr:cysteine peptidase family C39 domain-containing protein [Rectinemataceae bacterium]
MLQRGCVLPIKLAIFLLIFSETTDKESLRFAYCAEQGYDTSCGLTTLAYFMDKFWGIPAEETALAGEFFSEKLAAGDLTVSFADMAKILESRGFAWKAFRMNFEQFTAASSRYAPLIVHYDEPEGHFALALETEGGQVIVADPAEGTVALERLAFESKWSGAVLVAVLPSRVPNREFLAESVGVVRERMALLDRAAGFGL